MFAPAPPSQVDNITDPVLHRAEPSQSASGSYLAEILSKVGNTMSGSVFGVEGVNFVKAGIGILRIWAAWTVG